MSMFTAFGLMTALAAAAAAQVAIMVTLTVKDILEDRRRARIHRAGFPWAD